MGHLAMPHLLPCALLLYIHPPTQCTHGVQTALVDIAPKVMTWGQYAHATHNTVQRK
jgi:hypothetical protein